MKVCEAKADGPALDLPPPKSQHSQRALNRETVQYEARGITQHLLFPGARESL